ncbi:sensor histidine kinase [Ohtaekwangia koreensis]|uniref:Histidine kinase n=1 Tax=Ohtaekwangia koreensis TaxID=688867 RepID=A0A1T5J002_9BACT|nr:histidine kinase [Ohtaekwangia koreensis]SKC44694.1 Histidine kinase [Ohtaekwangia koreensis]
MNSNRLSIKKITTAYIAWWLLLISLETYAISSTFNFSLKVALADALNMNLLIATAGYFMFNSLRFYQPSLKNAFYLVVWSVTLAVLSVVLHRWLMATYIFTDDVQYLTYLAGSHLLRGVIAWLMIALIAVLSWVWFVIQDQQAYEKREEDAARLAREAELASLRQQLQPHFLFNSLNSISALAGSRPEQARMMIQQLSDFLRGTIKRDDQQLVTLEEELKHLQLYLEIEKVRFGHRLKTEVTKEDATLALKLPSLLLQPIVENAIKFGLYDTTGEITIRINSSLKDHHLVLTIENPFDPATAQPRQGTGFGLSAVQRRLYLLYARNDLLETKQNEENEHPIFITIVRIPQPHD